MKHQCLVLGWDRLFAVLAAACRLSLSNVGAHKRAVETGVIWAPRRSVPHLMAGAGLGRGVELKFVSRFCLQMRGCIHIGSGRDIGPREDRGNEHCEAWRLSEMPCQFYEEAGMAFRDL